MRKKQNDELLMEITDQNPIVAENQNGAGDP